MGETLTATDAQSLHQIPTDLPKGFYDANGAKIEGWDVDYTFPEVKRVIPLKEECTVIEVDVKSLNIIPWVKGMCYEIPTSEGEIKYFDKKIFDKAIEKEPSFKVYHSDRSIRIALPQKRLAVIMPLNPEKCFENKGK